MFEWVDMGEALFLLRQIKSIAVIRLSFIPEISNLISEFTHGVDGLQEIMSNDIAGRLCQCYDEVQSVCLYDWPSQQSWNCIDV